MEKEMIFYFDKEGDILDISMGKPREAISEEIDDDFLVRKDVKTGEVIGFTILNFEKRFEIKKTEKIPIEGTFRLSKISA